MTTYTAIPNGDIDPDSPITTSLMTLLRDNPIAITEGASGAPKIQLAAMDTDSVDTSQIVADAVGRDEISNSLATAGGSVGNGASVQFSLNDWALFPMIHGEASPMYVTMHTTDGGSGAAPRFQVLNSTGASRSYDVDHRYITAA